MNQVFDMNRTIQFSRLKLNLNRKLFSITVAGFLALIFVITFFIAYHLNAGNEDVFRIFHNVVFIIMLYGGAVFFGGRAYFEMNSPAKSIEQLLIPASVFEKYIVPLVFTSVGWMIFSVIVYQLFAWLTNILWAGVFHLDIAFYSLFEMLKVDAWIQAVKFYFLVHSMFFLGSAAFRKFAIPKTALAMFIIQNGLNLIGLIFILILFGNLQNFNFAAMATFARPEIAEWMKNGGMETMATLAYWASACILPIILYVIAYFKLKEREV